MKNIVISVAILCSAVALLLIFSPGLGLAQVENQIQEGVNSAAGANNNANPETTLNDTIASVVNILSIIVGIVAVIMLIVAGYRYTASGGDASKVAGAKNTFIYAIIGLIIAALSQIIVKFVLNDLK